MTNCSLCKVRTHAICAALTPDEQQTLSRLGRTHVVRAGQILMWEGDDSMLVANVIEGVLKLSTSTGDGREQIVGVVYPADFIGRPFGQRSFHTVTAITDATVCLFTRSAFDGFARTHPELEHKLLQRTLAELDRARAWMLLLGRKTASERIATFLLDMAQRMGSEEGSAPFTLPFGRQQMADVLGLTIETVSRQLSDMKRRGLIALPDRRSVAIRDRDQLDAIAEAA